MAFKNPTGGYESKVSISVDKGPLCMLNSQYGLAK
jgi:hypothetical protein